MPNVNLIAERREEKKKLERITRQLFFGCVGAAALFTCTVLYTGGKQLTLRSELADATAKMQKLQPALDRIKQVEAETAIMTPKVETLQTAKLDTLRWRSIFQVVSEAVPPSTWLSNLQTTATKDDTTLELSGLATTQSAVGATMTHLNSHPLFDKVDLRFTQAMPATTLDSTPRVQFNILARLRYIGPPKDDKKDKDNASGTNKAGTQAPAQGNPRA